MDLEIKEFEHGDADATAQLFNQCRDMWPWDFTDGIPFTADYMLKRIAEENSLALHLAVLDGSVRGYLDLLAYPLEPTAAYVGLILVHPDYHGRGLGRRLLQQAVETSSELDYRRLDLHTWPGNLKAVPLYKKTGFFWVPGTEAWMQNYIPGIIKDPLAREFFEKHGWYESFDRELDVAPDDEKWQGMRVFKYRWQGGDEEMEIIIDREARGLTAVRLDDKSLSCRTTNHRPPSGSRVDVVWEARGWEEPVPVVTRGSDHVTASIRGTLDGATGEITHAARISPRAHTISDEEGSPHVESSLFVDGKTVSLITGFRSRPPISLVTHPAVPVLTPGRETEIHLGIVNPGESPVSGKLYLTPQQGLLVTDLPQPFSFNLDPGQRAGFPLQVTAASEGSTGFTFWADLDVNGQTIATHPEELPLAAVATGTVGYMRDGDAYLCSAGLTVRVKNRGGTFTIIDRFTGRELAWGTEDRLGPPFRPAEFRSHRYQPLFPDPSTIRLSARSARYPGLTWIRDLTLEGHRLIISNSYTYAGKEPVDLEIQQVVGPEGDAGMLTLPLLGGLVRDRLRVPEYPARDRDLPQDPGEWAEQWMAVEHQGTAVGMMWGTARKVEAELRLRLTRSFTLTPGQGQLPEPLVIYAGPGTWKTVRQAWQTDFGSRSGKDLSPAPIENLTWEGAEDGVPLVVVGEKEGALLASSQRNRPLMGDIDFEAPLGWETTPNRHALREVSRGNPARIPIKVKNLSGRPSAAAIAARLKKPGTVEEISFPVIDPGSGKSVSITREGDYFRIQNGEIDLGVAPGFFCALTSLEWKGKSLLRSSYPEPGHFVFLKPWYGGLHPVLPDKYYGQAGSLAAEEWEAELVSMPGRGGLCWQGVRTRFRLWRAESVRGATLDVSYLTLPGSNLVAARLSLWNSTTAPMEARPGFTAFPAASENADLLWSEDGQIRSRKRGHTESWPWASGWAAVVDGDTCLATAMSEDFVLIDMRGNSPVWGGMWDMAKRYLAPGERVCLDLYLAATDPATAPFYRCLSGRGGLLQPGDDHEQR